MIGIILYSTFLITALIIAIADGCKPKKQSNISKQTREFDKGDIRSYFD